LSRAWLLLLPLQIIKIKVNGIKVDSTRVLAGIPSSLKLYLSVTPDNYNCYGNYLAEILKMQRNQQMTAVNSVLAFH